MFFGIITLEIPLDIFISLLGMFFVIPCIINSPLLTLVEAVDKEWKFVDLESFMNIVPSIVSTISNLCSELFSIFKNSKARSKFISSFFIVFKNVKQISIG